MTVLIAGIGELYQGDLDLGRLAAERLGQLDLGEDVRVEDVHYGALAFAQLLQDLAPRALVLVGARARGRAAGAVGRFRVHAAPPSPAEARKAIEAAGTGYVAMDLAVDVPAALGALPARTICVEVEPARTDVAVELSPEAADGLEEAVALAATEVRRVPLYELADDIRPLLDNGHLDPAPAVAAVAELVREIAALEESGSWGATFALRDRLRMHIAAGRTAEGMGKLDWALWWALIEELDRQQRMDVARS